MAVSEDFPKHRAPGKEGEAVMNQQTERGRTRFTTKELVLISILSATLTSGKLVLAFIPNVEIVTLLFIVYTLVFGRRRALMVSVVFTTTEVLFWGFSTWLIVYYLVWPVLILTTSALRSRFKNEYGLAVIAGLFGLTFGFYFAVVESFFYGLSYGAVYWLRGIPFDIIHGASNFITVLLLQKPLTTLLTRLSKNYF